MRRIIALLIALGLSLIAAGCGRGEVSSTTNNSSAGGTTPTGGETTPTGGTGNTTPTDGGTTATTPTGGDPGTTPTGGTTSGSGLTGTIQDVQHVIFVLQENRSFDSYFGQLRTYQTEQKGIQSDVEALPLSVQLTDRSGHLIKPFHQRTVCHDGVTPAWGASIVDYDDGKMDNFMHTTNPSTIDPDGTRAMGYYDWTDLPFYYEVATQFATSDRFFSSVGARTPVNRQYMTGASSYGNVDFGPVPQSALTIFDRLKAAGYTWKWYYLPQIKTLSIKSWHISKTDPQNIVPISQYFTDLQNNTLPQVAFIERVGSGLDEHPTNNIQRGAADMATEINALLASSSWPSTVMLLAWDEGGGLYDHVKPITVPAPDDIAPKLSELANPKPGSFTRSGFRVPLMVLSPWTKPGYVSHVPRELTSILKFIEVRFGLQPLTKRDAWADDMTEMFDFTTPALLTPPPLPEQPTNGHCNPSLEVSPQHP